VTSPTDLLQGLGLGRGDVVALVGAGGKTTLAYRLADEALARGLRVLVTTTTHMGARSEALVGPVLFEADGEERLRHALATSGRATLLGRRLREDKMEGVSPERVDELAAVADLVVVEADGARGRSLKVPAAHEPVVPSATTLLVALAALDVLGQPLDERRVHRLERVLEATGRAAGEVADEAALAAALAHPSGYPSRVPPGRRAGVFLNKAEDAAAFAVAERSVPRLVPPYSFVAAGSARGGAVRVWRPGPSASI
jgi:probable selenium-dependent hydroxylase accessory protein YqeC